jgi:hypothetical protein
MSGSFIIQDEEEATFINQYEKPRTYMDTIIFRILDWKDNYMFSFYKQTIYSGEKRYFDFNFRQQNTILEIRMLSHNLIEIKGKHI